MPKCDFDKVAKFCIFLKQFFLRTPLKGCFCMFNKCLTCTNISYVQENVELNKRN